MNDPALASGIRLVQQLAARGALVEAQEKCARLLRAHPGNLELLSMAGTLHGMRGETRQAIDIFQKILKKAPDHAATHHSLGAALQAEGRLPDAARCYRKALHLQPGFTRAHNDLGVVNQLMGKLTEAAASYRAALAQQPGLALTWYNLGCVLQKLDKLDEAERCLLRALELKPGFPEALNTLGITLQSMKRNQEAASRYQAAIDMRPGYVDALINLGSISLSTPFQPEKAIDCFQAAARSDPGNSRAFLGLGNALRECGRVDEALSSYEQCLRLEPGNPDIVAKIASIKEQQGRHQEAFELLSPFLSRAGNSEIATSFAAVSRNLGRETEAIEMLERCLADKDTATQERVSLHFTLGDLYDKTGQYDAAFGHFRAGNELKGVVFDAESHGRILENIKTVFNREQLAELPRLGKGARRPIFIVGMPRSGTTLTEQILGRHPRVQAAGEMNEINAFAVRLHETLGAKQAYPACVPLLEKKHLERFLQEYLSALPETDRDRPLFTDKLPHNFLHLGLIRQLFPEARVVHCVRDPRATCLSCYFRDFHGEHPYAYDLSALGRYYRMYQQLMAHWEDVLDIPIHTLRYEALVVDQEQETRRLLEFCGLEWDERCLDFHNSGRFVNTASYAQVRQPMYRSGMEHWKHYQHHLGSLIDALKLTEEPS